MNRVMVFIMIGLLNIASSPSIVMYDSEGNPFTGDPRKEMEKFEEDSPRLTFKEALHARMWEEVMHNHKSIDEDPYEEFGHFYKDIGDFEVGSLSLLYRVRVRRVNMKIKKLIGTVKEKGMGVEESMWVERIMRMQEMIGR